jgi:hypothetical protein
MFGKESLQEADKEIHPGTIFLTGIQALKVVVAWPELRGKTKTIWIGFPQEI